LSFIKIILNNNSAYKPTSGWIQDLSLNPNNGGTEICLRFFVSIYSGNPNNGPPNTWTIRIPDKFSLCSWTVLAGY
jgi:hypothetical protein